MDEAMGRLERGTYGICELCGGDIAEKRLIARPVTTMCIDCKSRQEALERARVQKQESAQAVTRRRFARPGDVTNLPGLRRIIAGLGKGAAVVVVKHQLAPAGDQSEDLDDAISLVASCADCRARLNESPLGAAAAGLVAVCRGMARGSAEGLRGGVREPRSWPFRRGRRGLREGAAAFSMEAVGAQPGRGRLQLHRMYGVPSRAFLRRNE